MKKFHDEEVISMLKIKKAYEESIKYFNERMYFPFDDLDYLEGVEKNKIHKQVFEISIIVFAIISKVVWSHHNINNISSYAKYLGIKTKELSNDEFYSKIFNITWEAILPKIIDRILLYQKDIKKLVEDEIYNAPHCIFYYFYLNPGNYSLSAEYTNLEEKEIIRYLKNGNLPIGELEIALTIKKIYSNINEQLVR